MNQIAIDLKRAHFRVLPNIRSQPSCFEISNFGLTTEALTQLILSKDLISFDIFDTLLARSLVQPTDLFDYLAHVHGIHGFKTARIAAESVARRRHKTRSEVSLEEIYAVLAQMISLPADAAAQEIAAEKLVLYANPAALSVLDIAQSLGKRVVAISDMYMSSAQLEDLLAHCGIKVDKVYSSSDLRHLDIGKYNGRAYPYVATMEMVSADRILHFGDNEQSDIAQAQAQSLSALHVERNFALAPRQMQDFGRLIGKGVQSFSHSVVFGTILRRVVADQQLHESGSAYRFGYVYGGPLVAGFLKFILSDAKKRGIDHLNLLARDGVVIDQAMDVLGITSATRKVLPASRRMSVFPRFSDGDTEAIISLFGGHKPEMTQAEFLDILDLSGVIPLTSGADEPKHYSEHIDDLRPALVAQARAERAALCAIYEPNVTAGDMPKRAAWVDVGWALTSTAALNKLMATDLPGYFVGSHANAKSGAGFQGYLFDYGLPAPVCTSVMRGVELAELVFSDSMPSARFATLCGKKPKVTYARKSPTEAVRDAFVQDVRRGLLAFLKDIRPMFHALDEGTLRTFNQRIWQDLCAAPTISEREFLQKIPHDRLAGGDVWQKIGDFWEVASAPPQQAHPRITRRVKSLVERCLGEKLYGRISALNRIRRDASRRRRCKNPS